MPCSRSWLNKRDWNLFTESFPIFCQGFISVWQGHIQIGISRTPTADKNGQKEERHFVMNQMMDQTGGWMDVDLGGDRRTGGGPAGRRDYQAVQEIIVPSRPTCERWKNSGHIEANNAAGHVQRAGTGRGGAGSGGHDCYDHGGGRVMLIGWSLRSIKVRFRE